MERKLKKVVKSVFGFSIAVSLLAGCATNNAPTGGGDATPNTSNNVASETKTEAPADSTAPKKVEIPEDAKLTWYFRGGNTNWQEADMQSIKELQKRTGIDIEFIKVTENQDDQ